MLLLDQRRAFGRWLFIAVCAGLALYLNSVSYALTGGEGDPLMLFEVSGALGYVAPVMPLIAALPFATGFAQDHQAGFVIQAVQRAGKRRYLRSKFLACALSGGLSSALSMLAFLLFLNLRFPSDFPSPAVLEPKGLYALLAEGGLSAHLAYYGARMALRFLSGAFWASSAMTFSAFYPNVPLTLCTPMVLYRLAHVVSGYRTIPNEVNLILLEDGAIGLSAPLTLGLGALVFGGLTALLACLFVGRAGRRICDA